MKKNTRITLALMVSFFIPALVWALSYSDGTLDTSFTVGGGFNGAPYSVLYTPGNWKTIVWGSFTTYSGTVRNRIARLNSDGTLDTIFASGSAANDQIFGMALQSDNKIIIGGRFSTYSGTARNSIARLHSWGTLDTTFATGAGANNQVQTIAIQPDGKVVIWWDFTTYNWTARNRIARLHSWGTLDTTFLPWAGANDYVNTIALQSDGKVIVGWNFTNYSGTARNYLVRLNTGGTLDTTFNLAGSGLNGFVVRKVLVQPDNKILVGGGFSSYNGVARSNLVRLNSDGTLDTSFTPWAGADSQVWSFFVQSDGKIWIIGLFSSYNGVSRNGIARLNSDGTLDLTFNPWLGANGWLYSFDMQADWKIVIAGSFTSYNGVARNSIARLWFAPPVITITAPTKLKNTSITDTTIVVTGTAGVFATGVSISTGSTATASQLNCTQASDTQVNCTISVDSSGNLTIRAVDTNSGSVNKSETNYIIDTASPSVPNITVNTQSPYNINNPLIIFSAIDNIAINYCELNYTADDGFVWTSSGSLMTVSPATSPMVLNLNSDEVVHSITVKCYDTAGNSSQNLVKFPPIVNFNLPVQISSWNIENATVTLTSPQGNDLDTIVVNSTISPLPTITNCVGSGADVTLPYASPLQCELHGITQSGTVTVSVRDSVNLAVGQNSVSFVIDTAVPTAIIDAPVLISNTGITNTTVTISDDFMLFATGVTLSGATTANVNNFTCLQINSTTVECSMVISDDGNVVVQMIDAAGNTNTAIQTGYIIDTVFPILTITDDADNTLNSWDTITVIASDDLLLQTGSLLYGFSSDILCDATDSYTNGYQSTVGLTINNESHNGEYVCFKAEDFAGNTTYVGTTNPLQIDTTAPTILLSGGASITLEVHTPFIEPWYLISDNYSASGFITSSVSGTVDTAVLGNYVLQYTATDLLWNTNSISRTVTVVDTTTPILTGVFNQTIEVFSGYTNSYVATDNYRPTTGITVTVSGVVNTSVLWNYPVTYIAVDNSGNKGTATKIVSVVDTTKPIVQLYGLSEVVIELNTPFTDPWAYWSDNYDGTWTLLIATTGSIDSAVPWGYSLFYEYTDTSGNTWNSIRTVIVKSKQSNGGGGWASILVKDNCPGGDYTDDYYDKSCGIPPEEIIQFDDSLLYNETITNGYCYTRKSNWGIINSSKIKTTEEFKKALTFLYAYDMTMFNKIDEFEPNANLTREQASKIFSNFAMNVLCRKPDTSLKISYRDVDNADATLKKYITLAYQLGLMK